MAWAIGIVAVCGVILWAIWHTRPRVPPEQVATEDLDLVRESDRAQWRRQKHRSYRLDKRQDDFYRVAAFRKAVAGGATEDEARVRVRREFPIYYFDPNDRDAEGFAGDDGGLPVVLRARVDASARVLKELIASEGSAYRTMNALVRTCIRKGAI